MKTTILALAVAVIFGGGSAMAYKSRDDNQRAVYSCQHSNSLDRGVRHLKRMLDPVRWQLRQHHGNWQIRREVRDISGDVDRVNRRFRSGNYNGRNLRAEVERLHNRLHNVEQRLQIRARDYYRWD